MTKTKPPARPRNIANDLIDAVETATSKWTRQKKSEERHPGMVRYRSSRMKGTSDIAEGSRVGGDGGILHGRQRRRQTAGNGAANLLPSTPQDHATHRG